MTDDDRLRAESAEIEVLLDEVRALIPAPAWERVERVLGRVIRMYGAGLGRTLDHARAAGAAPAELTELLAGDDLVASLLLLHGLHPVPVDDRVRRAVANARAELGLAEQAIKIDAIDLPRRTVRLHTDGPLGGGAMAARVAEGAIRRAIEAVAPELAVEIVVPPQPDPSLVQIRARREAR